MKAILKEPKSEYYAFLKQNIEDFSLGKEEFLTKKNPFMRVIVIEEKEIVGVLIYSLIYERVELDYVAVAGQYRHRGYGEQLMQALLEQCRLEHCQSISLEVREGNDVALQFYRKLGFEKVAMRKQYYKSENGILMVKQVKQ